MLPPGFSTKSILAFVVANTEAILPYLKLFRIGYFAYAMVNTQPVNS